MKKNFLVLQDAVIKWGYEKGILPDGSLFKQRHKILEELGETSGCFVRKDVPGVQDGIGDICVTLIISNYLFTGGVKLMPNFYVGIKEGDLLNVQLSSALEQYTYALYYLDAFAKSHNFDLNECLYLVLGIITKRSGSVVDGCFIKNEEV